MSRVSSRLEIKLWSKLDKVIGEGNVVDPRVAHTRYGSSDLHISLWVEIVNFCLVCKFLKSKLQLYQQISRSDTLLERVFSRIMLFTCSLSDTFYFLCREENLFLNKGKVIQQ